MKIVRLVERLTLNIETIDKLSYKSYYDIYNIMTYNVNVIKLKILLTRQKYKNKHFWM